MFGEFSRLCLLICIFILFLFYIYPFAHFLLSLHFIPGLHTQSAFLGVSKGAPYLFSREVVIPKEL